jgi:uridine phosphorylase
MKKIAESELVLNPDGSVYHLKLKPENIADYIIVVGDQGRVESISKNFSKVEFKIQNREFVTHTGLYKGKRITALSTGIGTDNIDIVLNELDAAVNIDLNKRIPSKKHRKLNIIRLGTSGALQKDIPVDSFVASSYGMGFDGLLHFYKDAPKVNDFKMSKAFIKHAKWEKHLNQPYSVAASPELLNGIAHDLIKGVTATASGFYAPQGRILRLDTQVNDINSIMTTFKHNGHRITNFEMETSALYGLGQMLGHNTLTICTIVANRLQKKFSKDYKKSVEKMIKLTLDRIVEL